VGKRLGGTRDSSVPVRPRLLLVASIIGALTPLTAQEPRTFDPGRAPAVTLEQNKAVVRRWIEEGFNKRNPAVVDEIFVEDVVIGGQAIGRARLRENMRRRLAAFPDLVVRITDILAEGDKVVIWYAASGTHRGEFEGIAATGRRATWIGSDLLRLHRLKIAEGRFLDDSLGLFRQLRSQDGR
jgi:predicted ester cyclase